MKSLQFNIFADYFQFYIQDETAMGDLSQSWDEEASTRLLAFGPGVVGIGTVRNMDVPIALEVHDQEPADDFSTWDHVVECDLTVVSGRIVIAGCTDYFPDAARIDVAPGEYRVRASYGALSKVSENGLDGEDHYRLQLWRALPLSSPRILKQRSVSPSL